MRNNMNIPLWQFVMRFHDIMPETSVSNADHMLTSDLHHTRADLLTLVDREPSGGFLQGTLEHYYQRKLLRDIRRINFSLSLIERFESC